MCTYVFWRKLCKCGHSEQLLTDPQGSDWLKAMLTLKVFSFFSSLHFPLLSLSWNNTSGKFLVHYFFFLYKFGEQFYRKSVYICACGTWYFLWNSECQLCTRHYSDLSFVMNLEITVSPMGGQITVYPKISKCIQLSKNGISVKQVGSCWRSYQYKCRYISLWGTVRL